MGLFDFLKKNPPATEENSSAKPPDHLVSAPRPAAPVPSVSPAGTAIPTAKESGTPISRSPRNHNAPPRQRDGKPAVLWPRIGDTVPKLIAQQQIRVFVDALFIKSTGFPAFSTAWREARQGAFSTRYYFIPTCEKVKLSPAEQTLVNQTDCQERPGADLSACFGDMATKGLKWNIVYLTTDGDAGYAAQQAAKDNGIFLRWYGMDSDGKVCPLSSSVKRPAKENPESVKLFHRQTEMAPIQRTANPPRRVPSVGEQVLSERGRTAYRLEKALMTDHSSVTYATNDADSFAKIYTETALQLNLFEAKANRMLQNAVDLPGVCWPKDTLRNGNGDFVGILIPASKGVQLTRSVLNGATGLSRYFPNWDKRNLCVLASTVLKTVCGMYRLGLSFGYLNPASIYVQDEEHVFFVDTDSWQIEGYPAMSRNQTFTPPELLREEKQPLMTTVDQENYEIAVLTFMLMMPGKFPYAKKRSSDERESIINMSFPFSANKEQRRSGDAERPGGVWQMVWDHLPYRMCNSFYNSFHAKGQNSAPGNRLRATEWLNLVNIFQKKLSESGREDSRAMFPRTFRRDGKRTFFKCQICGQEHPGFYFMKRVRINNEWVDVWERGYRVCLSCASGQSDASFKCQSCGRTFYYSNRTKITHEIGKTDFDYEEQKWCRDCKKNTVKCRNCGEEVPIYKMREFEDRQRNQRITVCGNCFNTLLSRAKQRQQEWNNAASEYLKCRQCGRTFPFTNKDAEFYRKKGWSKPIRCPNCREKR